MKVYLVGGAVRDRLMGYPVKEKDWVVVGGRPDDLLQQGYQQVGKDFPVFLHPQSREEYALARTERKHGSGYYGFECTFDPNVSLEEDLARRDLTINAMAMDESGQLIDPYNGLADLKNKLLRHVSPAFVEDPVRVLRVARFAARYHHLGYQVADETRALMYSMVRRGELNHLIPERIWQEWKKSLEERNPAVFITTLRSCGALSVILPEINALFGIPNWPHYHPEIDSGVHTLMVLEEACSLTEDVVVRFAALMHDLGKIKTSMQQWPAQHGHEQLGLAVIEALCQRLRIPADYRKFALLVCRYHLIIHQFSELKPSTVVSVLERADAFRRPERFKRLLIACKADSLGKGKQHRDYPQLEQWCLALEECQRISAKSLMAEGYSGKEIKSELHQRRSNHLKRRL